MMYLLSLSYKITYLALILLPIVWCVPDLELTQVLASNNLSVSVLTNVSSEKLSSKLRICDPTDLNSHTYCKCGEKVTSCDFTYYPTQGNPTEFNVYGYLLPESTSRLCVCNTPPNLHIVLRRPHFLPHYDNRIYRFDFFNLTGVFHIDSGFNMNFQGDLYIANVTNIPEIPGFAFARGNFDSPIPDVQDLDCCSPIKVNQENQKPLLYIANTTIDHIQTRGIDDYHLWKTMIFRSVLVNTLDSNGIRSDLPGVNVAILNSTVVNSTRFGIRFEDTSNLLMIKNKFPKSAHYDVLGSRSSLTDSHILLMDNSFFNGELLDMDAHKIVLWFNNFNVWDNWTFHRMQTTHFQDRSVSFKYNLVYDEHLVEASTTPIGTFPQVTFTENVLGLCNCSSFVLKDNTIKLEANRCYTGNCSLRLDAALLKCPTIDSKPNFDDMCKNLTIAVPGFPGNGTDLMEDIHETRIDSTFINDIVQDFRGLFGPNRITKLQRILVEGDRSRSDKPSSTSQQPSGGSNHGNGKHKSVTVPVMIALTVIILIVGVVLILMKNRHYLRRSSHHRLDDGGSREIFM